MVKVLFKVQKKSDSTHFFENLFSHWLAFHTVNKSTRVEMEFIFVPNFIKKIGNVVLNGIQNAK